MNIEALLNATSGIVARNITNQTMAATVNWDSEEAKLELSYLIHGPVTEEDEEVCELALTELLAEFPEIILADCRCRGMDEELLTVPHNDMLVFRRNGRLECG